MARRIAIDGVRRLDARFDDICRIARRRRVLLRSDGGAEVRERYPLSLGRNEICGCSRSCD